jgi:Voltage-dependent anion channel
MVLSFKNAPAAIGGVALGNFGMAIMIYSVSTIQFNSSTMVMRGSVYAFVLLGLLMLLLYFIRFASDPVAYFRSDFSSPSNISSVGTLSMAICLMGKAIANVGFPASMCASVVYIGAFIQAANMIPFFISCWRTKTWPEPFWNNVVHSSLLSAVALQGDDKIAVAVRAISVAYGLVLLIPVFSIMAVRTIIEHEKDMKIVANNPTVVVIQSCCSITCSGWFIAPLTDNATTGIGGLVGQVLFGMSTFGFCCAVFGAYQRRETLMNIGECPSWVAISFPFTNTALAAGQYLKAYPDSSKLLFVWSLILSVIAAICVMTVNIIFFRNWYFLFSDIVPEPTESNESNQPNEVSESTKPNESVDSSKV